MTPFICLVFSIVCLLASLALSIKKQYFWAIVCLLMADLFIVVPWSSTLELIGDHWGEPSIPQRIIYMIGLEDWTDVATGLALSNALGSLAPIYSIVFSLLCIVTPVVAGVTAYSIVTQKVSYWWVVLRLLIHRRLEFRKPKTVILQGINRRTMSFIDSLYSANQSMNEFGASRQQKRCLCVVTDVSKALREKHSGEIETLRKWPVLITEQSAHDLCSKLSKHLASFTDLSVCFFSEDATLYGDSESKNVSEAVQLIELFASSVPERCSGRLARFDTQGVPRYHFNIACKGKSDELVFDSIEGRAGFDIHVVDEGREVIYDLLWRHPLHEAIKPNSPLTSSIQAITNKVQSSDIGVNRLVVVIFGWGHYGFEAFRACAWSGQIPGIRLHIHIVDKRPEEDFIRYAKHVCPGFFANINGVNSDASAANRIPPDKLNSIGVTPDSSLFDFTYHMADAKGVEFDECVRLIRHTCIVNPDSQVSSDQLKPYCIVTLGDDDTNTDAAIDIKRLFCGDGELPVIDPIIHVDIYDTRRHKTLSKLMLPKNSSSQAGQIIALSPFGGVDSIFNYGYIQNSDLEALALNVNASYSGNLRRDSHFLCSASERASNYLEFSTWQMFRLSNITNAMAIKQKLWLLGYRLETNNGGQAVANERIAEIQELLSTSDNPLLELMARGEHDRWMAFYLAEGWTHESPKTSNLFKELGLNDSDRTRHDSHLLLRHPFICGFDSLPAVAEEVGRQDPTSFDIHFIGDLAKIISDTCGYSGRSFGIAPIESQP